MGIKSLIKKILPKKKVEEIPVNPEPIKPPEPEITVPEPPIEAPKVKKIDFKTGEGVPRIPLTKFQRRRRRRNKVAKQSRKINRKK